MVNFQKSLLGLLVGAMVASSSAQVFPFFGGGPGRTGRHDAAQATNNPDRAFLRWWDPLLSLDQVLDNWETGTTATPLASWLSPDQRIASFYEETNIAAFPPNPPYYFAATVPSSINGNYWQVDPATVGFATFDWTFGSLLPGNEYAVYVNIPVGESDADPSPAIASVFGAQHQVYEITGVENADNPGQPIYQLVDTFASGGGWVRLGNNGNETTRVFRVSAGSSTIRVRLMNTVPRDSQGNLVDTRTNIAVYADAARISQAQGELGTVIASPTVRRLSAQADPFQWRAVSTRLEDLSASNNSRAYNFAFPSVTSFFHAGYPVETGNTEARRNIVWSWPATRPFAITEAEVDRYTLEKLEWLQGVGTYPGPSRFDHVITTDNLNGNVQASGLWTVDNVAGDQFGTDYYTVAANAVGGERVTYRPILPEGSYRVEAFVPTQATGAPDAVYEVILGGVVVAQVPIDQSTPGWKPIVTPSTLRWRNTSLAALEIAVTNQGSNGTVIADAIRFTKDANIAVTSSPAQAEVAIDTGAGVLNRDVVVVAMENGRLYCLDAKGNYAGTTPTGKTQVYWTYPSELAADPNKVAAEDGKDGIAEMPAGFDISSALIVNVNTGAGNEDLLYIASTNGRIYCLEMQGRGDGTTRRRWTYPDDFPSASVRSTLGPITGSVAFANTAAGPTLFVPTPQGRLYALDAVGNAATKTTSLRWAYPGLAQAPVGPIRMSPLVEFGNVYFGTGDGAATGNSTLFAVNMNDTNLDQIGEVVWSRTQGSDAVAFNPFLTAGFASAPAADLEAGMGDTIFVGNSNFRTYAFRASDGVQQWLSDITQSTPSSNLTFTYMRVADAGGALSPTPVPCVVVPTLSGEYRALYANNSGVNVFGNRGAWRATLQQPGPTPSMAVGALDATLPGIRNDQNGWMFGADSAGFTYGFSYDPDFGDGGQQITPGIPPIQVEIDNDVAGDLNDLVNRARGQLITPGEYQRLLALQRTGSLTYADIQTAVANGAATRVNFEFGETLYFLIYDLADPNFYSPALNYTIDISLDSPGASTQRRTFALTTVQTPPDAGRARAVLATWALTPVGNNSLTPGEIDFRLRAVYQGGSNNGANRTIPPANILPIDPAQGITGGEIRLANPMAVSTVTVPAGANQIGYTLDPRDTEVLFNGNRVGPTGASTKVITQGFGTDVNDLPDIVSHGNTGLSRMFVWDRSLLTLLFGPQRGLQNVRMQVRDLYWPLGETPVKLFDPSIAPNMEDLPGTPGANNSLDYPDIRRDRLNVVKERVGSVENPLFQGVGLVPPELLNQNDYFNNVGNQYNLFHPRNLAPTLFDFDLDVPKFQPPTTAGYQSSQVVFVDNGGAGFQFSGNNTREAYRFFDLNARVAIDERLSVGTPTVDLGSVPIGGGFSPLAPWNDATFSLDSPLFHDGQRFPYFQRFTLFNEGNVNMLNLRMAKMVQAQTSAPVNPVVLFAPSLHFLSQIDARWHLHSDLDSRFLNNDILNRGLLQKARPGDGEATRFRANPRRRFNPNLAVADGDLIPPSSFPNQAAFNESKLDPKLGVSVPIGMPVGRYVQEVFPFEDTETTGTDVVIPRLTERAAGTGIFEPYSDPGIRLSFEVRESRLTNRQTNKSVNMVDDLGNTGNEVLNWQSAQPAAARDGNGTLMVAFASERINAGNVPGFLARPKVNADADQNSRWRIYIATLPVNGNTPTSAYTTLSDLSAFGPATNSRWFTHAVDAYPNQPASVIFGIPAAEIDATSVSFSSPAFPALGTAEPLVAMGNTGKPDRGGLYMAFVGEIDRAKPGGERVRESRLLISEVQTAANGSVTVTNPVPLTDASGGADATARIGRPSVVQVGNNATVFYPLTSNSSSQIVWSHYNGANWISLGGNVGTAQSLNPGSEFDALGSPSAVLRRYQNQNVGRINLTFTGRLKGRTQPDIYLTQIAANGNGIPVPSGGNFMIPFTTRLDRLEQNPRTGMYWSQGVNWRINNPDLTVGADDPVNPLNASFIDVKWLNPTTRQYESVLDHNSRTNAAGSKVYTYKCLWGGQAQVDTGAGSIRFIGTVVPRGAALYVRYTPRILRVSDSEGQNYRMSTLMFDERYFGDPSYWVTAGGSAANFATPGRNDRFFITYQRTAASTGTTSQPYMKTMRFGIQLPYNVATGRDGRVVNLTVTGANTPFQIEPSTGRIYFMSEMEDRTVDVSYLADDESGRPIGVLNISARVGLLTENTETVVPMSNPANESALALALDPISGRNPLTGFNYGGVAANERRPGLLWMFWSSTRGGGSDVYFQTIAPNFGTVPTNR